MKCSTVHETKLLNYLTIILQLCLRLNTKFKEWERIKVLTPKEIFQRLLIALAKIKARNKSENLMNKITQNIYSLY